MPIILNKRGSNPDPAFDVSQALNDANMSIIEGAVADLEAADAAHTAAIATKLNASDPSVTNRRGIAEADYAAFTVDAAGNASFDLPSMVTSLLGMNSTQAADVGAVILAESTVVPTSATFRKYRDGTDPVVLFTPVTFKLLINPIDYAYSGTSMTIDFGDAGGGDPDVGKIRTLNPRITGITGNLTLTFAGFADTTLIGQEICVEMVSNAAGSKTLAVAAGGGQTVISLVGASPPVLGDAGKRVYLWIKLRSNTEVDVIAWGATP